MPLGLYIVATPIGNLGDISRRAAKTLESVDFIAAEDTRVTVKLLSHLGIKKPMIPYHAHNLRCGEEILERIASGESCALCSDAGTPAISDPGELLVRSAHERDIPVFAVPGCSAVVAALSISGKKTGRFCFEGFLSTASKARREHLEELKNERRTMVFYEAPHKLLRTLVDMQDAFGEREISIVHELTKIYEYCMNTTLGEAIRYFTDNKPKGEFVLIIEGASEQEAVPFELAMEKVVEAVNGGRSLSSSAKEIASLTGHSRSKLYNAALAFIG